MTGITPLRTLSRTSPTFKADCNAFFGVEMQVFSVEAEAARLEMVSNAAAAAANASAAASSKAAAQASEANLAAMTNFKGTWASLAGALAKPASVLHNGTFWALLNNLGDVTASQPGVSADWVVVGGGFPIVVIAANTVAVPWRTYLITAACTLTMPAIAGDGKQIRVIVLPGVSGAALAPAGADKVRGVAGTMTFDSVPFDRILTDSGATYGWV